jgi:hypothetical protein
MDVHQMIYHVYPWIYQVYCVGTHAIFMYKSRISTSRDIHGISDIPSIFHVYVSGLHTHGIYHVYAWYITENTGSRWTVVSESL